MRLKDSNIVLFLLRIIEKLHYASKNYIQTQSTLIEFFNFYQQNNDRIPTPGSLIYFLQQERINVDDLKRIGSEVDGGYLMLKSNSKGIAISVGVGQDVSWDLDMCKQGFRVYMFDHTVNKPPKNIPDGKFFKIGIKSSSNKTHKSLLTLDGILKLLNLEYSNNLILKIDVEGSEWDVFQEMDIKILDRFDQILVEFHELDMYRDTISVLKKLLKNHAIIHVNPNNYSRFFLDDGFLIPNTLEITFVRRSLLDSKNENKFSDLTYRNDKRVPAINNNIFRLNSK